MGGPPSKASSFISTFISWGSCPARSSLVGSNNKVMVSAPSAAVSEWVAPKTLSRIHSGSGSRPTHSWSTPHRWALGLSTSHGSLRTSILAGARDLWSKCLIHALASVVAHRDERSWVDLLTMPALTLGGPARGGRHHAPRQAINVSRRCQDWLDGLRGLLWEPSSQSVSIPGSDFRLYPTLSTPTHISNRVATLIQDGALRRACTALAQEPPAQATTSVIDELQVLHPRPRQQDSALLSSLRDTGPAAVPCVSPDMIRKAVSDFSPTSGAGASGLRPGHLQQAMRLATGDQLLSLLAEVVQLARPRSSSCRPSFSCKATPSAGSRAISHLNLWRAGSKTYSNPFRQESEHLMGLKESFTQRDNG